MPEIRIAEIDLYANEAILEISPIFNPVEELMVYDAASVSARINVFWYPVNRATQFPTPLCLFALFTSNVIVEKSLSLPTKTADDPFGYHLYATVSDEHNNIVRIGDVLIQLDTPLPKDIHNGSFISFDVVRLDL